MIMFHLTITVISLPDEFGASIITKREGISSAADRYLSRNHLPVLCHSNFHLKDISNRELKLIMIKFI